MKQRLLGLKALLVAMLAMFAASQAAARTATYVGDALMPPGSGAALSTSGDNAGLFLAQGATFALYFDQPFGEVKNGDNISIFTLAPSVGKVRFSVSFGVYNAGAPTIVTSRQVNAGGSISTTNLFQQGCAVLGGCDYIEITIDKLQGGATGAEIDYVDVNGEVTYVASPTPEPGAWALMILGFSGIAMRMKALRRRTHLPAAPPQFG